MYLIAIIILFGKQNRTFIKNTFQLQWYWEFSNILIDEIQKWNLNEEDLDNIIHLIIDSAKNSENERIIIEYEIAKLIRSDREVKEREKETINSINVFDLKQNKWVKLVLKRHL